MGSFLGLRCILGSAGMAVDLQKILIQLTEFLSQTWKIFLKKLSPK